MRQAGFHGWGVSGRRLFVGLVGGAIVITACSAVGARPESASQPQASLRERTMVMVLQDEPTGVAGRTPISTGSSVRSVTRLFNAGLLLEDAAYGTHPYLAENVPKLNTDSWRLFPDGSMETVYRLKPNVTWHDGHVLSAGDFVFAWEVYAQLSATAPLYNQAEVLAPDNLTVLIRWRVSYPDAGSLYDTQFIPLPRHILGSTFRERDIDRLVNHPYWSTEFVGPGPYRLEHWEPGSFIEGVAFEGHVLGRPKIERVRVHFIPDENTVLANFVAGEVHATAHSTLRYQQVKVLRERGWSGTTVLIPIQPRFIHIQLRPEVANPGTLTEVRVRKALAYAIDKPSLDAAFFDGADAVTYSMTSPRAVPYYADIDRAITKYPYDLQRAQQLMNEAGLTKGADGVLVGADGQRFITELWGDSGVEYQRDSGAIAEGWQRIGVQAQQNFISRSQLRDNELRSKMPLYSTASGSAIESFATGFTSSRIPSPANRWQGGNRGGWSNAEYDRLSAAYDGTLDRIERNRQIVQMEQIVSEELPIIMLWHNFHVVAYASSITGPDTRGLRDLAVWNIHEWEMR